VRFTVGGVSVPFSQVTEDMQGQMSDDEYMVSRLEFYFSSRTDFHVLCRHMQRSLTIWRPWDEEINNTLTATREHALYTCTISITITKSRTLSVYGNCPGQTKGQLWINIAALCCMCICCLLIWDEIHICGLSTVCHIFILFRMWWLHWRSYGGSRATISSTWPLRRGTSLRAPTDQRRGKVAQMRGK
jgi:hypothetical protein